VITAGIDLAAQPERTAAATMKWTAGGAVIEDVVCRADDEDVLRLVERASKTGIDCPFGWPAAFVGFVSAHHASHPVPAGGPGSRRKLIVRRTDLFVHEQLGLTPLSVSADRIACRPSVPLRWPPRYRAGPGDLYASASIIVVFHAMHASFAEDCAWRVQGGRAACQLNASR
jgi:Protein of unknown function (DUF429)